MSVTQAKSFICISPEFARDWGFRIGVSGFGQSHCMNSRSHIASQSVCVCRVRMLHVAE